MSIINIRLSDAEEMLARQYAEERGMTISELAEQALLEKIKEEESMNLYQKYLLGRNDQV